MAELQSEDFANRWQELHFEEKQKRSESASSKSDVVRNVLSQLQLARYSNLVSPSATSYLFLHHADSYGTIVDSPLEQNGLDNFAEGALASLEGKRNESDKWKSSMTIESVTGFDCVQSLLKANQAAHASLFPPNSDNLKLNLRLPKKNDGEAPQLTNLRPNHDDHLSRAPLRSSVAPTTEYAGHSSGAGFMKPHSGIQSSTGNVALQGKPGSSGFQQGPSQSGFWNMGGDRNHQTGSDQQSGSRNTLYGEVDTGGSKSHSNFTFEKSEFYRRNESVKRQRGEEQDSFDDDSGPPAFSAFKTAREQLVIDQQKKYNRGQGNSVSTSAYGTNKKSLGTRRGLSSKFVPPVRERDEDGDGDVLVKKVTSAVFGGKSAGAESSEILDEKLKNIEPKMVELITSEIMDHGPPVSWDDIAGLEFAKKTIKEIVVWPMLRPDIFTGLRGPPKGLLLFGPPGTGKTLIGKCIASQSKSTFFSISASSLTSKWVGEGEKMVRALFAVSRVHQPAVIFIDEIDSLLSQRSDGEHEASRRIKTEFLVQLDGANTGAEDRILVVGATNRPQEIDEAARRRFVKRLYIPLPEGAARLHIVTHLLSQQSHDLSESDLEQICLNTDGYSGSDMANLCREAAMGPIRSMAFGDIENITAEQVRPINYEDFMDALKQVRASVSKNDLDTYLDWNKQYGSWGIG